MSNAKKWRCRGIIMLFKTEKYPKNHLKELKFVAGGRTQGDIIFLTILKEQVDLIIYIM